MSILEYASKLILLNEKEPLQFVRFYIKIDAYVFVNMKDHFHNRDSYSKVEVILNQCLFIDFTYEILIQIEEKNCQT